MSNVVELLTGHVFMAGSVKAVTPLQTVPGGWSFEAIGVGFRAEVKIDGGETSLKQARLLGYLPPDLLDDVEFDKLLDELHIIVTGRWGPQDAPLFLKHAEAIGVAQVAYAQFVRDDSVRRLLS